MRRRSRALARSLAAILLVGAVMLIVSDRQCRAWLGLGSRPHPTDDELIAIFRGKRADFERLRTMLFEDLENAGLRRVDRAGFYKDLASPAEMPRERAAEYHRLLFRLNLVDAMISNDRTIQMAASAFGFVTHGSDKGFLYVVGPEPGPVVEDLDVFSVGVTGFAVRSIGDNWYLYFNGI